MACVWLKAWWSRPADGTIGWVRLWGNVPICMGYFIDPTGDIPFSFSSPLQGRQRAGSVNEELSEGRSALAVLFRCTWRAWVFTNTSSWTQALWLNWGFPTHYSTPPRWLMIAATCRWLSLNSTRAVQKQKTSWFGAGDGSRFVAFV